MAQESKSSGALHYRLLVRAGGAGLPVGRIQNALAVPSSTLSHHIATLVRTGLVQQRRDGRVLICTADYARMRAVLAFLTAECCDGIPTAPGTDVAEQHHAPAIGPG